MIRVSPLHDGTASVIHAVFCKRLNCINNLFWHGLRVAPLSQTQGALKAVITPCLRGRTCSFYTGRGLADLICNRSPSCGRDRFCRKGRCGFGTDGSRRNAAALGYRAGRFAFAGSVARWRGHRPGQGAGRECDASGAGSRQWSARRARSPQRYGDRLPKLMRAPLPGWRDRWFSWLSASPTARLHRPYRPL